MHLEKTLFLKFAMSPSEDISFIEAYLSDNNILKAGMASPPVLTLYTTFKILSSHPKPYIILEE